MKFAVVLSALVAVLATTAPKYDESRTVESNFQSFLQWKNVSYESDVYSFRLGVFAQNMERAKALGGSFGINRFADTTLQEFRAKYTTGYRRTHVVAPEVLQFNSTAAVPDSVDWRLRGVVTKTFDQGECGSCWAVSTVNAIESQWAMGGNDLVELSIQQLVDCDKVDAGCDGGDPVDGYAFIKKAGGISLASSYPYTSGESGKDGTCTSSRPFVTVGREVFAVKPCYDKCADQDEAKLQAVLATVGPLSICIDASDDWMLYTNGVFSGDCKTPEKFINHCVGLVGYGTTNGEGWWLVRNSWGPEWGESGYIRLPMGVNKCSVASEVTYTTVTKV